MLFVLAGAVFFWTNFQMVEVKGQSMADTLKDGRRLLVSRAYWLLGDLKKGDIVVIRHEEEDEVLIKRIVGMPGDRVDWVEAPTDAPLSKEYRVPEGMLYVVGDNWPVSQDSREFGPIPRDEIIGKVILARLGF